MSNAPSSLGTDRPTPLPDAPSALRAGVASALATVSAPFRFAGFWLAVALPVAYLPVLAGRVPGDDRAAFGLLLAVHALALVAGHGYRDD